MIALHDDDGLGIEACVARSSVLLETPDGDLHPLASEQGPEMHGKFIEVGVLGQVVLVGLKIGVVRQVAVCADDQRSACVGSKITF